MTLSPNPYDIPVLLQEIEANGKQLGEGGAQARQQCLAAAQKLCYALETPMHSILRIVWAEVYHSCFRTQTTTDRLPFLPAYTSYCPSYST